MKGLPDQEGSTKKKVKDLTPISAEQVLNILRRISDDDLRDMGLNNDYARPEWMVTTVLAVPPPPVRPRHFYGRLRRRHEE